jgi:hypothetical protein
MVVGYNRGLWESKGWARCGSPRQALIGVTWWRMRGASGFGRDGKGWLGGGCGELAASGTACRALLGKGQRRKRQRRLKSLHVCVRESGVTRAALRAAPIGANSK